MSRSPLEWSGAEAADHPFMQNQNRLYRFIREGKSFSGHERNCCFLNLGNGNFANVSATSGLDFADDARALAVTDWDHDGDLDLWVTNRSGPRVRFLQNEVDKPEQSLQLRLVGKHCNRDAIGARVTVFAAGTRQMKTLTAGDGYLAQSSKWLHFGCPPGTSVERVLVQWPGGDVEALGSLVLGERYLVTEGEPPRQLPRQPRDLTERPAVTPHTEQTVEARLLAPVPTPPIRFETTDGELRILETQPSKLTAVMLWASWCRPCLDELQQLSAVTDELERAGVVLVPLSVDGLAHQPTRREDAVAMAGRLELPFPLVFANAETVERLQQIHNQCFGLHTPLPLPSTLLFDDQHRLIGVLKGKAEPSQLVRLAKPPTVNASKGNWIAEPRYDLAFMVSILLEQQALDDAIHFLRDFEGEFSRGKRYATVVAQLGTRLVAAQRTAEAEEFFEEAVALDPRQAAWQNDLATTRHLQGRTDQALPHFRIAAQLAPDNLEIQRNLVSVLLTQGKTDEALSSLQAAIDRAPRQTSLRVMLGDLLRSAGKVEAAIAVYRAAYELEPDHAVVVKNLGATLLGAGRLEEAIPILERATRLEPQDPGAFKNLGLAYAISGRVAEAVNHLEISLKLAPGDASVHNNLGGLLAGQGNFQAAVAHFQRAVQLAPQNPKYQQNLEKVRRQVDQQEPGP